MIVFARNDRKIDRIIVLVITQRSCETAYLCLEIGDVIGVNVFPSMLMRFPTPPQKGTVPSLDLMPLFTGMRERSISYSVHYYQPH